MFYSVGMAETAEGPAEVEEARLTKELGEEKLLRANVKKEAKDMRKQLARKEQRLQEQILELDTKLRRANGAQRNADGLYSEAQQLFDHSNLVLAAQSRRMDEMARRRQFAEEKLAVALSPRSKAESAAVALRSPAAPVAAPPAASTTVALEVALQKPPAAPPNSPDPLPPVQQQALPATPQSPLRAGLHVSVRFEDATASGSKKEPPRQGRIVAVSPTRESCSVVFDNGDVNQSVPIELLERQRQEWEFRPQLHGRFASEKTLAQKVTDKRKKTKGKKVMAGSGAAAAQATLIKHAPSLSFLKVLSTSDRMAYFQDKEEQEEAQQAEEGGTAAGGQGG